MIDTIACICHRNIALDIVQKDSWKRQLVACRNKECPSMDNINSKFKKSLLVIFGFINDNQE
jgi:hypothetical protein